MLHVALFHLRTIMGGLTAVEFTNLLCCIHISSNSVFPLLFLSSYMCICALVSLLTCNVFYLMLVSTGYLALPALMVSSRGQYSNFTFNIFIASIYYWARVSTRKDCSCCCSTKKNCPKMQVLPQSSVKKPFLSLMVGLGGRGPSTRMGPSTEWLLLYCTR